MMTLQELKQSVETAAPGQKIPTAKNIRESGVAVAKEKLDGDTEITAYRNGYVLYSNCRSATVFPIHTCGGYMYGGRQDVCSIECYSALYTVTLSSHYFPTFAYSYTHSNHIILCCLSRIKADMFMFCTHVRFYLSKLYITDCFFS